MALQQVTHSPASIARTSGRRRPWSRYSSRTFYLFISPWLVGFVALTVIPMVYALLVSFTSYDGISRWHWVGISNYVELIYDSNTWFSISRTLLYVVLAVPLSIAGGLGLALLVNMRVRFVGFFRTLFYLPTVVPIVAGALTFRLLFDNDNGPIDAFIGLFHGPDILWLGDPLAIIPLLLLILWGMGGGMVLSLAGLQGIPQELKEAAKVDGASAWYSLRSVILPLLSPILFFQVVTGVIAALQVLVQPLLLTNSNAGQDSSGLAQVPRANYLYMVNVFAQFFQNERFGYGAALLWVLFACILLITILLFRTSALWVYYEVDQD
jgi:multiple sugar transport system permease protein